MPFSFNINLGKRSKGQDTQIVDCLHDGDSNYTAAGGFDLSSYPSDFTPDNVMHGLDLGDNGGADASGNISVVLEGGGVKILAVKVSAGESKRFLWGERIKTLVKATTTFDGKIFPNF